MPIKLQRQSILFALMAITLVTVLYANKDFIEITETLQKDVFTLDKDTHVEPLPTPYNDNFAGWQKFAHTEPFVNKLLANSETVGQLTRVIRFQLQGSAFFFSTKSKAHMAIHIDHLYEDKLNKSFGILIGNISARKDGCKSYPAVQIEHFTRAWVHYNENNCKSLDAEKWYDIQVVTDGDFIFYQVFDSGKLIEEDSTQLPASERATYIPHGYYNVGFTMLSKDSRDKVFIKNVVSGYYLVDFFSVVKQLQNLQAHKK